MLHPTPADLKLYQKSKKQIYQKMPIHSAYRSGHVVQAYKRAFAKKYGPDIEPYITIKKPTKKQQQRHGLTRWFAEEWRNQQGQIGYHNPGDIYRPTKRITRDTPKTFKELTPKDIAQAKLEKQQTGRVKKFSHV